MVRSCPHCHAPRPPVSDAYCGDCREPFEEPLPLSPQAVPTPVGSPAPRPASGSKIDRGANLLIGVLLPWGLNLPGLAFLAVAAAVMIGVEAAFGLFSPALVFGVVAFGLDLSYRRAWLGTSLLDFERGGQLIWVPMWGVGVIWVAVGLVHLIQGP